MQTSQTHSEQLELFKDEPFSLRVSIDDAVRIFRDNYWCHLPFGKKSGAILRRILLFFKGHHLDTISKADVERFRRWLKEGGYSESTINKHHMTLSRIFRKFEEYKEGKFLNGTDMSRITLPGKNPAAQVPKINEQQFARRVFITKADKRILCSLADEDLCEIIDGLYWTQLRPSDFFRITDHNADLGKMVLTGIQNKTITTRNPSGVPYKVAIPQEKIGIIKRRVEATKPGTPIFRRTNLQKRWGKVRELAGMSHVQLRDLRGSAASFLLDNGVDVETVRKGLGHTTLRMLPVYDKRPEERVVRATEKLVEA